MCEEEFHAVSFSALRSRSKRSRNRAGMVSRAWWRLVFGGFQEFDYGGVAPHYGQGIGPSSRGYPLASTFAPAFRSALTAAGWPSMAAMCKAVQPWLSFGLDIRPGLQERFDGGGVALSCGIV